MRYIFIFLLFISNNFANTSYKIVDAINNLKQLELNIDEKNIDKTISKKSEIYKSILTNINKNNIEYIDLNNTRMSFLEDRISTNLQRQNILAVHRDRIELQLYKDNSSFNNLLKELVDGRKQFFSKEMIANIIFDFKNKIDMTPKDEKSMYESLVDNNTASLVLAFKNNYNNYEINKKILLNISTYLEKNVNDIYQKNLVLHLFNLDNYLSFINTNTPFIKDINSYLEYYFSMTFSRIVIAIVIVTLIIIFTKIMIYFILRGIEIIINKNNTSSILLHNFLHNTFNLPLYFIIYTYGIELFFRLSMTNTDYIDNIVSYIYYIYFIFFIWLGNKIIDNYIIYYSETIIDTENSKIKTELINFFVKMFKIIMLIVFGLILLKHMGYNITTIVASLGIGGIAIALASKDTFSNLFGSFNIMLDDVFSQGEIIQTEKYKGVVVEIGIRSTTIRTFDNALVTIPNAKLAEDAIINWSKRKIGREIKFIINVSYNSNVEELQKCITEIEKMLLSDQKIADTNMYIDKIMSDKVINKEDYVGIKNKIRVRLYNFSDYSIQILVHCFTKDIDYEEWIITNENIMYKLIAILKSNNLEFVYPSQNLFIKK